MVRSQILLEEWQYQELKRLAAREKTSLSGAVRSLLARLLRPDASERERLKIVGFLHIPGVRGRDHDKYLYGDRRNT